MLCSILKFPSFWTWSCYKLVFCRARLWTFEAGSSAARGQQIADLEKQGKAGKMDQWIGLRENLQENPLILMVKTGIFWETAWITGQFIFLDLKTDSFREGKEHLGISTPKFSQKFASSLNFLRCMVQINLESTLLTSQLIAFLASTSVCLNMLEKPPKLQLIHHRFSQRNTH